MLRSNTQRLKRLGKQLEDLQVELQFKDGQLQAFKEQIEEFEAVEGTIPSPKTGTTVAEPPRDQPRTGNAQAARDALKISKARLEVEQLQAHNQAMRNELHRQRASYREELQLQAQNFEKAAQTNNERISQLEDELNRQTQKNLDTTVQASDERMSQLETDVESWKSKFQNVNDRITTFRNLCDAVGEWAWEQIVRLDDDPALRKAALEYSANNPGSTAVLRTVIRNNPGYERSLSFMRSDIEIVTSIVWGFLMTAIFAPERHFYTDEHTTRLRAIRRLEQQMVSDCKSKDELYTISVWRNMGCNAIVKDPALEKPRALFIDELTESLVDSLMILSDFRDAHLSRQFASSLKKKIVGPAVAFHELILCERSQYFLQFDQGKTDRRSTSAGNTAFYNNLSDFECVILGQGPLKVLKDQLSGASIPEIRKRLDKLCDVSPGLIYQMISERYGLLEAEVLVQCRALVLFDQEVAGVEEPGRTFLHELILSTADEEAEDF